MRLEAALTQLKSTMDVKKLHYEDLSGRPKNLCASRTCCSAMHNFCSTCNATRLHAAL